MKKIVGTLLLIGAAASNAAFLEPLLIETIPLAFRKKVSIHNASDFLLDVKGRTIQPGKSIELLQDSRGGVLRWNPVKIAYRGSDPRLSGLTIVTVPTPATKKITVIVRMYPNPDTDSEAYKAGLARVFGFDVREEK